MSSLPHITFCSIATPREGTVVILADEALAIPSRVAAWFAQDAVGRAAGIAGFSGKLGRSMDMINPAGTSFDRLVVIGTGNRAALDETAWPRIGGAVYAATQRSSQITVIADLHRTSMEPNDVGALALGTLLRSYRFDKYRTKKAEDDEAPPEKRITIMCADPAAAEQCYPDISAIADGVLLARELVNEPANALGTLEFAAQAKELTQLGVEVSILGAEEMAALGMGALLGVSQGSVRPPQLVIMRWMGGDESEPPVAFVGKGVVFDSGGLSIKPAAGMEDMKGDMGGGAAVLGTMHVLARRKAKANVVGVVGIVENMVDAHAQRPGDIVTSMSGQTIEVLNTDAEGRLVLADALWYVQHTFGPRCVIDLATLTGAMIIGLGHEHAGLFSNNDPLADQLVKAGLATDEKVWRLPLSPAYDKLIDSKNADIKNIGGRAAGSITAAQFLQRFVKDTPWAHIDIAGTAFGGSDSETNKSWASGFGVRLLDRFVRIAIEADRKN
jgi:leucyl aminopeptidase